MENNYAKNIMLDFMMGMICILLIISVIGIFFGLEDALSAWSAMRMNEKWKENEEDEDNF
jgi:hypothetical protein